jgi:hypothetical protein
MTEPNPFDENTETTTAVIHDSVELDEVDVPEADVVPATATTEGQPAAAKPTKSTKPPVPEGYITPVAFAKKLSEREIAEGRLAEGQAIAPQMIYSYVNQGKNPNTKNPLKSYSEGGRENLLKEDEAFAWWDAKEERKVNREANKAAKATAATETAQPAAPVVEAE